MQEIWSAQSGARPPVEQDRKTTALDATPTAEPSPDALSRWAQRGVEQLVAAYQGILKTRALSYPVPYQFGRELGRGRQGIVFVAYRHGARGCLTRHAIKLFDPSIYGTVKRYWTDMGRIATQITRLQTVQSPNLVGRDVYEEAHGVGYVQMEAVDGLDMQDLLYGRHFEAVKTRSSAEEWARFADVIFRFEDGRVRIQPGIVLYIMRQALRGLEALHDSGYVHCDVKPSNLMVDRLGTIKLVDYGRANLVNEKVGFLLGSPLFMAPEIHLRETYSAVSDLYSLGLVGIELLRGEPIADPNLTDERALLDIKRGLPSRLPDLLPAHVKRNKEFVAVLRRMIDPDPARRYTSAEEAETGALGLALLHKQLTILGKDSEYYRDLESYISKLFPGPAGAAPAYPAEPA